LPLPTDPPPENFPPEAPTAEELIAAQTRTPVQKWRDFRDVSMILIGIPIVVLGFIRSDTWMVILGGAMMSMPGMAAVQRVPPEPERDPRDPGQREWRG
jgi:hypothetical protein